MLPALQGDLEVALRNSEQLRQWEEDFVVSREWGSHRRM